MTAKKQELMTKVFSVSGNYYPHIEVAPINPSNLSTLKP